MSDMIRFSSNPCTTYGETGNKLSIRHHLTYAEAGDYPNGIRRHVRRPARGSAMNERERERRSVRGVSVARRHHLLIVVSLSLSPTYHDVGIARIRRAYIGSHYRCLRLR